MTAGDQWRCAFCETWNLASSSSCLVCERKRSDAAPRGDDSPRESPRPVTTPAPSRIPPGVPPASPPPSRPVAHGAPLAPSPSVIYVTEAPKKQRWWLVPAIILAVGLLVTIGVIIGIWASGGL